MHEPVLSYEGLEVYQRAIEFVTFVAPVLKVVRRHRSIGDQLLRASLSVALNIAEGAGKTQPADRASFYAIARGSAMECGAILDVCYAMQTLPAQTRRSGKQLLVSVVAMLSKMCR